MLEPAGLAWFARHEMGLAWRDFFAMMTGGRRRRGVGLAIALTIVAVLMHLMASGLVSPWVAAGIRSDKPTLVLLTGGGLLFWSVMLSQAMESVTRAYYARADLDLILSSPASAPRLFAVRTGAIALSTVALSCLLASPIIDMLAILDGAHWLTAYLVLMALGAGAVSLAMLVTVALFRLVGPGRTRFIAQVLAAIVGAGFIIGIQAAAILSYGHISRYEIFRSAEIIARAPDVASPLWLPARAALGDPIALAIVLVFGFGALALTIAATASSFGRHAIAAAGISQTRIRQRRANTHFRRVSQRQALRRKEWRLLLRDPWLVSQTLMQILYLLPPALLLWLNFGRSAGSAVVVVPVLVMAAGQLAGGLAWLAISGEDAHDLVATAPVAPHAVLVAKIESVLVVIAVVMAPILLLVALSDWRAAVATAAFAALSAGSATAIQLWFRVQARRSLFRRRQVSSRMATISEALASIMWAGCGALAVTVSWLAIAPGLLAAIVLAIAFAISPARQEARVHA
jgi:ABC-2 type transport system permease protein